MVSAGVPDMPVKNVNIVDQDGNLLTQQSAVNGLDASQLKYVQQIEHNTQKRIDAILAPLFGAGNARSQVSADIDFSKMEQTAESYGPNANPQQTAIRSQQSSESNESSAARARGGVPGALSNQPPQAASAPIVAAASEQRRAPVKTTPRSTSARTRPPTYEVDRTVRHYEQAIGGIKRLSVAVVVNYKKQVDAKGHVTMTAAFRRQARAGPATGQGRNGLRRKARRLGERGQQHLLGRARHDRPMCRGGARRR